MYEFVNADNADEYESFVQSHENGFYTQSLIWPKVKFNWESEAVISRDEQGKIRGACLVLIRKISFPRCSYLYAPRGPVCDLSDAETISDIMAGIDALAKKHRAFAATCDPQTNDKTAVEIIKKAGFTKLVTDDDHTIQCRFNSMLIMKDKTLDEVRASFKSKFRNGINRAQKEGVWCEEFTGESAVAQLDDFCELMEQTGKRDNFPTRPKGYFKRMLEAFGDHASLFMSYVDVDGKKTPISGGLSINYSRKFMYAYGASGDAFRKIFPSYLLMWTMISAAHERGCTVYDFGGLLHFDDESRREEGLYHFKKGFGTDVIEYAGQFTKVYRPLLNRLASMVKSKIA